jgi:Amt family ammonium transporter
LGVSSYGAFCFISSVVLFKAIDLLFGLRVTEEEEIIGLDIGEHEMESYAGFQIFSAE